MFGLEPKVILLIVLVAIAVGALAYSLMFKSIDTERKTETRLSRMSSGNQNMAQKKAARPSAPMPNAMGMRNASPVINRPSLLSPA